MAFINASPKKIRYAAWAFLSFVLIAYLLVAFFSTAGKSIIVRDLFYEFSGFLTILVLVYTAFKIRNEDHRLWIFVAACGVFWMLGDVTYRGAEILGIVGAKRVLSPADIFYILAYASIIFALQAFSRLSSGQGGETSRWNKYYMTGTVVMSFFVSGLLAFAMPNGIGVVGLSNPQFSFSTVVNYVYPALDIVILTSLLLVILTHNVSFKKPWQGIGIFGFALYFLADINYSLAEPAGIYSPEYFVSRLIIAVWLLAKILILMAAVYRLTETSERLPVSGEIANDALVVPD